MLFYYKTVSAWLPCSVLNIFTRVCATDTSPGCDKPVCQFSSFCLSVTLCQSRSSNVTEINQVSMIRTVMGLSCTVSDTNGDIDRKTQFFLSYLCLTSRSGCYRRISVSTDSPQKLEWWFYHVMIKCVSCHTLSSHGRTIILVSGVNRCLQISDGNTLIGTLNTGKRGKTAYFDQYRRLCRKRYKIGPLLCVSLIPDWSLSHSMTSIDLESRDPY